MATNMTVVGGRPTYSLGADTHFIDIIDGRPHLVPMSEVQPPTAKVDLHRSFDGVVWDVVALGLDGSTSLTDHLGLSNGETWYRATAYTSANAASETVLIVMSDSGAIWLSGGDGYEVTARLPFYGGVEITPGRARATHRYAGRANPVAYAGEQISRVVKVSGMTADVSEHEVTASRHDLERLAQIPSPIFMYRSPDGDRIFGVIRDIPQPRISPTGMWGYSFELEETDH